MKYILALVVSAFLISCGGGGGSSSNDVYIKVLDGYIVNADVKDDENTPVRFVSDEKSKYFNYYRFFEKPKGNIHVKGGFFLQGGLKNKFNFTVPADTKIITPVVVFINKYPKTIESLEEALDTSEKHLRRDYIKEDNILIARFAQIIYALSIHGYDMQRFSKFLDNVKNYEGVVLSALRVIEGTSNEKRVKSFILSLDDFNSVSTLEKDIFIQKKIMQQGIVISDESSQGSDDGAPSYLQGLDVKSVDLDGNLALHVEFSEDIENINNDKKSAIKLSKIMHSMVKLDENETANVGGKTISITLQEAIKTDTKSNTYKVHVKNNLRSSQNLPLQNRNIIVSQAPSALVLEDVIYLDSKHLKIRFNLPIDGSTIHTKDFLIKSKKSAFIPVDVSVDEEDNNFLNVILGNVMTKNLGYDFTIKSANLASIDGLNLGVNVKKEFVAKVVNKPDLNEGFNLMSASVNKEQKEITLYFSKVVMSNPTVDMFSVSLDQRSEPIDINITQDAQKSALLDIKVKNLEDKMLSKEQNVTYLLSVEKQTIFSKDGKRTLGASYQKDLEVKNYPKVTNASINSSSINLTFNMPMEDINATKVTLEDGNITSLEKIDAIVSGSDSSFSISRKDEKNFNGEIVRIKLDDTLFSKDKKSVLLEPFVKDFNLSQ